MSESRSIAQAHPLGTRRVDLFTSLPFMACLVILVLNDWVFKAAWHNALTGKLSDFAGVALFALFWCALFPRKLRLVLAATALGFAWWKSPLSQPMIELWNAWLPMRLGRTVDYSDLMALLVLPAVGAYVQGVPARHAAHGLRVPLALCALAAMMGTSRMPPETPEYRALMQVRSKQVSHYAWREDQLDAQDARRLIALLGTLPDKTVRAPTRLERREHRDDVVIDVAYELPDHAIQVWFYPNARRTSEFGLRPRHLACDQALAQGTPATDSLLRVGIEFSALPAGPWVTRLALELCDLPQKRSAREALRYFFDVVLPSVEAALNQR